MNAPALEKEADLLGTLKSLGLRGASTVAGAGEYLTRGMSDIPAEGRVSPQARAELINAAGPGSTTAHVIANKLGDWKNKLREASDKAALESTLFNEARKGVKQMISSGTVSPQGMDRNIKRVADKLIANPNTFAPKRRIPWGGVGKAGLMLGVPALAYLLASGRMGQVPENSGVLSQEMQIIPQV